MGRSVRVSEEFHEFLTSHNRDGETMEETIKRLIGGPRPEEVTDSFSSETAERMRARIENKKARTAEKSDLRERFE